MDSAQRTWSHVGFDMACGAAGGITVIGALIAGVYAASKLLDAYDRVLEQARPMSSKQNRGRDPEKRAAKRRLQREARARGAIATTATQRGAGGQATHATNPTAAKKQRHGERLMANEHAQHDP